MKDHVLKFYRLFFVIFLLSTYTLTGITSFIEDDPAHDQLPPSILPVIILQGSDYQMGFQYGCQAAAFINMTKESKWASSLEHFNREEVIKALKANQIFIKSYTPEWIDFMKGMAEGVRSKGFQMTYIDILLINCTLPDPETTPYPPGTEIVTLPPKHCSVCSSWGGSTKDGHLIGIDTLDSSEVPHAVVIAAFPNKGNAYICGADAGEIGDHFLMNNKGLFIGNSGGGGSPRHEDSGYGLAWSCSLPYLARFSDNAVEARDRLVKWQINIPENFHFVDTRGNAFVVEKTAALQCVRKSGDFGEKDFLFSTNNYLCEKMKPTKEGEFIGAHGGYGAYSAPRNKFIWDMLHNYHGKIDIDFAKMILRFPGSPPPYPPQGGWDAVFCRPTNLWTAVVMPDNGNNGTAYICTGPVGKILHASIASDGSVMQPIYKYIDGTHTFYRLLLAEDPLSMAEAAHDCAGDDISAAYSQLMLLNYSDPGNFGLNSLYGKAVREYFEGINFLNKARLTEADDSLFYLSKAVTYFTRSQAHARQVYEELVPPPTSPSDLGLNPFGGDWAEWETRIGLRMDLIPALLKKAKDEH